MSTIIGFSPIQGYESVCGYCGREYYDLEVYKDAVHTHENFSRELIEKLADYHTIVTLLDSLQKSFSSDEEKELDRFMWILRYAQRGDDSKRLSYRIFSHIQKELAALQLSKKYGCEFRPNKGIGSWFSPEAFRNSVKCKSLIDYDGYGEYSVGGTELGIFVSNVEIKPSDLDDKNYKMPEWATGIVWYNR